MKLQPLLLVCFIQALGVKAACGIASSFMTLMDSEVFDTLQFEDEEYEGKRIYALDYVSSRIYCCRAASTAFHVSHSTLHLFDICWVSFSSRSSAHVCIPFHISFLSYIHSQPSLAPTLTARMRMKTGMRTRMRSYNNVKYWTRRRIEKYEEGSLCVTYTFNALEAK